jgi:hypothetical protein
MPEENSNRPVGPSDNQVALANTQVALAKIYETGKVVRTIVIVLGIVAVAGIAGWVLVRVYATEFWYEVLALFFGPSGFVVVILCPVLWSVRRKLKSVESKFDDKRGYAMIEHIAFASVGVGMAITVGYAFWIRIRVLQLKADLLTVASELRDSAARLGQAEDQGFQDAFRTVLFCAEHCQNLSLPVMVYLSVTRGQRKPAVLPRSDHAEMQAAIESSMNTMGNRVARYILIESAFGLLVLFLLFGLVCIFVPSRAIWDAIRKATVQVTSVFCHPSTC